MASCLSKPLLSDCSPGRKYSSVKVPADQHEQPWWVMSRSQETLMFLDSGSLFVV